MNRLGVFLFVFTLVSTPAIAQTTSPPAKPAAPAPQTAAPASAPFPADARYAFVNLQFVFGESELGKQGNQRLLRAARSRSPEPERMN